MPPKKSTKSLPATADTTPQQNNQPDTAPKLMSVVLAALREEEESGSTNNSSSDSSDNDEEITNTADESNPEAGEEDNESDPPQEVPIAVLQKRAKASKNAATPKSFAKKTTEQGSDAGNPPTAPVPPARKINYNLLFFSAEDLACCNPKAGYLILGDDIPWEDFYAHMKIKACDQLFPNQPVVHNNSFDMNFAIARHVPIPLSLASAADYAHLTNASKIKKNPTIKVSLTSHTPNLEPGKENIATAVAPAQDNGRPELKGPAEKKKKSRAPRETNILPANFAINSKIRTLWEQWECNVTSCKSDFCFVPAEGLHFPLGHGHFEKWAAAILRGDNLASMEKLPNILLFDPVSSHTAGSKSPLLQARLNVITKEKAPPPPPAAPVVNVILPNDMFNPYQHP
ncbi:hypothetical protein K443DRAFT_3674 [Laccaria amethystina LaAM-08-1]|uniref:Unplaced genomic scaffold K443scaffold_23, whole genome shotgun sequence n=1 Tax=Laccaria amethystina LaAM-08-1 TaxID=1095629 RepID=A0A0C9X0Q6_9AGAR|nr:hypothetical protein K443DRAFT_3674 [Laccaria amethystina LaAM-08-1]